MTPIGINLPNDQEVREKHGSKSVSIANVVEAYERSTPPAAKGEFCWDEAELERTEKLGPLVSDLHTNMHEVIGHASGRQAPDKQGDPAHWIKENYSALEEARADLVALWFLRDKKLQELGLVENVDEASRQGYEHYTRNGGLVQLRRMKRGRPARRRPHAQPPDDRPLDPDEQHGDRGARARRQALPRRHRSGQVARGRGQAARARAAAQEHRATTRARRSSSTTTASSSTPKLRDEVVARYAKLNVPSYTGFVMPRLQPVMKGAEIVDVAISYPLSIEQQMLEWSGRRKPPEAPAPK